MLQLIVIILIVVFVFSFIWTYWYVVVPGVLAIAAVASIPPLVRHIRKNRYFASSDFQARRAAISALVAEHNEIAEYASAIRDNGRFSVAFSTSGEHAHLASSQNTSSYGYRRDRNVAHFDTANVHNCSLQIVRNASQSPIKYLIKYFHIGTTEHFLGNVEVLGERISRLEDAIANLKERESGIATTMTPPEFILKFFRYEFMKRVGVKLAPISVPYPVYVFEYVSAGGNSGQKTTVMLNTQTIDTLIEALSEKIRFRNSAAGQRALMTAKLREHIKRRDEYTCNYCGVALSDEPHLLLEVDHIVPVSKGGMSTEANLQTLCWRCNRENPINCIKLNRRCRIAQRKQAHNTAFKPTPNRSAVRRGLTLRYAAGQLSSDLTVHICSNHNVACGRFWSTGKRTRSSHRAAFRLRS